jgi:methylglutaconyl-CoA hydratase
MIHQIKDGHVKTETHQGITTIEFYHPKSNSLPSKILEELAQEIHFAGTHAETKVIILKSEGDHIFCSGASIDELKEIKTEAQGTQFFSGFATSVDYAIALTKAEIKLSELALGIGPFVVGPAVERKIGVAAFSALAIDAGKGRNSDWAKRKGFYAEVHDNVESMDESVSILANKLSHYNPLAMTELKTVLWHGTEHWDVLLKQRAAISGRLVLGSHTRNFIEIFTTGSNQAKAI